MYYYSPLSIFDLFSEMHVLAVAVLVVPRLLLPCSSRQEPVIGSPHQR